MNNSLKQRYIYAVTRELPMAQRADIEKELHGLIEDMLEERSQNHPPTDKDLEEVLYELGKPQDLVDKYRDQKRFLIGPDLYPFFIFILKIVFMAISISMVVLLIVRGLVEPSHVWEIFLETAGTFISAISQAFIWITIMFGLSEYFGWYKKEINLPEEKEWRVSDLPQLPDERNKISRAESIFTIIFLVIGGALVSFALDLIGIWIIDPGVKAITIPFFNNQLFKTFLPLIYATIILEIIVEMVKLVIGKWNFKTVGAEITSKVFNLLVGLIIFSNANIWNSEFLTQIREAQLLGPNYANYTLISGIWNNLTENIVFYIILVFILSIIGIVVRLIRLNTDRNMDIK
ncbi:MAG: hypothetical protein CVU46_06305 [Chloroflexi bacterium HGW-Chloroflexi-8]|nr:MAG: hypothetical protein CVU46_06305 [Chloroflexi bacterium HGW-Chloroflexi-8]